MDTNRLSPTLAKALNDQMTAEAFNAQIYLAYGAWASDKGYDGISNLLFRHQNEERTHMMKFLEYVLERGAKAVITEIPAPGDEPTSVYDCFEKVYKYEVQNTQSIYNIVNMALEEKDWITWNFLQSFIKEQAEEETLAMNLLGKAKIAGGENAGDDALYNLDRDLGNMPDEARIAQEVSVENP